jgi:hypothetical protein
MGWYQDGYEMERSRMSLDWLAGYELRRGWRGPSPNIVVVVVVVVVVVSLQRVVCLAALMTCSSNRASMHYGRCRLVDLVAPGWQSLTRATPIQPPVLVWTIGTVGSLPPTRPTFAPACA